MGLLCAFGIPWSNAFFNVGFYCMVLFFILSFSYVACWKKVLSEPIVILGLSLFFLVLLGTLFTDSSPELARYDLVHYRKLLAIPLMVALFRTQQHKAQLFISYCLGVVILMLPTLLDGFGLAGFPGFSMLFPRNVAYSALMNGAPNLVYWRNQIVHGFHVSILFSACLLGVLYLKTHRPILITVGLLCAIDLLFFIYGRMALFSLLVAILAISLIYLPSKKQVLALVLLGSAALCTTYIGGPSIKGRIDSIDREAKAYVEANNFSTSAGQRLHYWKKSWELFQKSPIFGNGSGSFRQSLVTQNDPLAPLGHRHTHDEYLTQLAQYGIAGLLLFLSLILVALKKSKAIESSWLSHSVGVGITLFALNAITDSSLHNDWEGWTFVLLVSIAASTSHKDEYSYAKMVRE